MTETFCTLKQAADRLETTEAEIELMLNRGVLREFRDGSRRLLKVADLAHAAKAVHPTAGNVPQQAGSPPAQIDKEAFTLPEPEITLPPTATATARAGSHRPRVSERTPHQVAEPAPRRRIARAAGARKPGATPRRPNWPHAVVISPSSARPRPRPQTHEVSLRQWLWAGLVDDNPLAVFIIFGIVLLGTVGLAGTLYLLMRVL
jgi:hypothetical protein